jgi:hypothetical protein
MGIFQHAVFLYDMASYSGVVRYYQNSDYSDQDEDQGTANEAQSYPQASTLLAL